MVADLGLAAHLAGIPHFHEEDFSMFEVGSSEAAEGGT